VMEAPPVILRTMPILSGLSPSNFTPSTSAA
jgi:hypothetical protein